MIRTQVQLTEEQARLLRRTAAERGVSMAELIREAVDGQFRDAPTQTARTRAINSIGGFRSGNSDISAKHDDYLADAFRD